MERGSKGRQDTGNKWEGKLSEEETKKKNIYSILVRDTHVYESFSKLRTRTYMKCSYKKDKRRRIRDAHFVACIMYTRTREKRKFIRDV